MADFAWMTLFIIVISHLLYLQIYWYYTNVESCFGKNRTVFFPKTWLFEVLRSTVFVTAQLPNLPLCHLERSHARGRTAYKEESRHGST